VPESPTRIAVVAAGAGARGAYEAGALSVLVPELAARGLRPTVFVGTSAGAINATALAATAHLEDLAEMGEKLLALWRSVTRERVFRSLVLTGPQTTLRYAGSFAGLPLKLSSLLDTQPLVRTAATGVEWRRLHENVSSGLVDALAVVATSADVRSTVFVHRRDGIALPDGDEDRALDYLDTAIEAQHVLASCAIPFAFEPTRVDSPASAAGWYTDGGVRLNVPLKPAIALGADGLVVVATHPDSYPARSGRPSDEKPDLARSAGALLAAALSDPMIEDLRTLDRINDLAAHGSGHGSQREYRVIPYVFAGPRRRDELGVLAADVYRERYGGVKAVRSPDFWFLHRLLGDEEPGAGDLLSYVFFEPEYIERAIELGRRHARKVIGAAGDPFRPPLLEGTR
jgi:NTE family protein